MKKTALTLALILALFSVTFAVQTVNVTKASPPFSSGIYIIEPNNTTYNPETLTLKINLTALINYDINYFMTYSLDGNNNDVIPIEIAPPANHSNAPYVGIITGSVTLPELYEGSHRITVYESCTYPDGASSKILTQSYENTVFFTIDDGLATEHLSFVD